MAIDFFVMPLSRYLAGAFITPTMRFAWSQGGKYMLMGRETREIPQGEPFGGPDAQARRESFLAPGMLTDDLAQFPAPIPAQLWDEASVVEPRFHRVDPASYGALLEESEKRQQPGLLGFFKKPRPSHLTAQIYFPVAFDEPFITSLIFEGWRAGSVQTALRELGESPGTAASQSARETLRAALNDAAELRLPLIVDT